MASYNLSAGLAILAGILTVFSPCILPILPILVGRSLTSHRYGPLALVAGLIGGFATIGSLVGVTASWFVGFASLLRNMAVLLLILAGLTAIFPQWNYRFFSYLNLGNFLKEPARMGLLGEFLLGTQLGLLWTPCAGSILGSILILAAVQHEIKTAFLLLVFYGLGAGMPLLAIAYGGRYLSRYLGNLRSKSTAIQKISGIIVASSAVAILLGWDVQIQLWLAPIFPTLPP